MNLSIHFRKNADHLMSHEQNFAHQWQCKTWRFRVTLKIHDEHMNPQSSNFWTITESVSV